MLSAVFTILVRRGLRNRAKEREAMQAADDSEVLKQIHEIGELLRLAQTPEGLAVRRAFLMNRVELQELRALIRELMAAGGQDAIKQ
jgi:hypothetical protein